MPDIRSSVVALVERWKVEQVQLLPPVEGSTISKLLSEIQIPIAHDVVEIYSTTGGMADGELDANSFSLWPLERVIIENRGENLETIEFADFLIDSHRYAFKFVDQHTSSIQMQHYDESVCEVSGSAAEFFQKYASAVNEHDAFVALHG